MFFKNNQNLKTVEDQEVTLTIVNQTWFKILAIVSFSCALFVYAALIWLLVCRANRLPESDESIKKRALFNEHVRTYRRRKFKKKQHSFKRKLRYLIFGNAAVRSPDSSCQDGIDEESTVDSYELSKARSFNELQGFLIEKTDEQKKRANKS